MKKITVANYLIQELQKIGINHFFGLPGDFNFNLIEAVENNPKTTWIPNTNELNAGYAADGYSRINGFGAVITTYGVGELSAINAIAGSFAENIPVIMIVGIPKTDDIYQKKLLHHNFSNPDYMVYSRIYSNVVNGVFYLNIADDFKSKIDKCISLFISEKKPVYIAVPKDICNFQVENNSQITMKKSNKVNLLKAKEHILNFINKSKNPIIITDSLIERFFAQEEVEKFILTSNISHCDFFSGKGLFNGLKNYLGTYLGKDKNTYLNKLLNTSDCVISIGTIYGDFNTLSYSLHYSSSDMVEIQGNYVIVEKVRYENVLMKDVLNELVKNIRMRTSDFEDVEIGYNQVFANEEVKLSASYLYPRLQEFLKPEDILFTELGTSSFGVMELKLPLKTRVHAQSLWGSIGWATPAIFGAAIADRVKRFILVSGEGAHQLTVQEISNIIYYDLKPIIFIINNSGYTIERLLSGHPYSKYNNINNWNYTKFPMIFSDKVFTAQVHTNKEFDKILKMIEEEQKTRMCYIELFTDKMDLPELLKFNVNEFKNE